MDQQADTNVDNCLHMNAIVASSSRSKTKPIDG